MDKLTRASQLCARRSNTRAGPVLQRDFLRVPLTAFMYAQLGAYDRAVEMIEQIKMDTMASFPMLLPWGFGFLSCVHSRRGDLQLAAESLEQARRTLHSISSWPICQRQSRWRKRILRWSKNSTTVHRRGAESIIGPYRESSIAFLLNDALLVKGTALAKQNKLDEANTVLAETYTIAKKMNSRRILWQILIEQSHIADLHCDKRKAENCASRRAKSSSSSPIISVILNCALPFLHCHKPAR